MRFSLKIRCLLVLCTCRHSLCQIVRHDGTSTCMRATLISEIQRQWCTWILWWTWITSTRTITSCRRSHTIQIISRSRRTSADSMHALAQRSLSQTRPSSDGRCKRSRASLSTQSTCEKTKSIKCSKSWLNKLSKDVYLPVKRRSTTSLCGLRTTSDRWCRTTPHISCKDGSLWQLRTLTKLASA